MYFTIITIFPNIKCPYETDGGPPSTGSWIDFYWPDHIRAEQIRDHVPKKKKPQLCVIPFILLYTKSA